MLLKIDARHWVCVRQFTRQFRVCRQPVAIWANYRRRHHPEYRCIVIEGDRRSQLPQDGNVLDAIPRSQVEATDVGPEDDQEAEPDTGRGCSTRSFGPKICSWCPLGHPRRRTGRWAGTSSKLPDSHGVELPNIRHIPIDEFNRSHALLFLAFPCLFLDSRAADFVEPRLRSIDYKDYIEHATTPSAPSPSTHDRSQARASQAFVLSSSCADFWWRSQESSCQVWLVVINGPVGSCARADSAPIHIPRNACAAD